MRAQPAFPSGRRYELGEGWQHEDGMDLRDYFAGKAPDAPTWWLDLARGRDRNLNPYNDSHKPPIRGELQLRAAWAFEYADAMLEARGK